MLKNTLILLLLMMVKHHIIQCVFKNTNKNTLGLIQIQKTSFTDFLQTKSIFQLFLRNLILNNFVIINFPLSNLINCLLI